MSSRVAERLGIEVIFGRVLIPLADTGLNFFVEEAVVNLLSFLLVARELHLLLECRAGLLLPLLRRRPRCQTVARDADDVCWREWVAEAATLIAVAHNLLVVFPAPRPHLATGVALEGDLVGLS